MSLSSMPIETPQSAFRISSDSSVRVLVQIRPWAVVRGAMKTSPSADILVFVLVRSEPFPQQTETATSEPKAKAKVATSREQSRADHIISPTHSGVKTSSPLSYSKIKQIKTKQIKSNQNENENRNPSIRSIDSHDPHSR